MAKSVANAVLDAALNYLSANVTQECLCSSEPTTYAQATTTYKLGIKTGLTSGSFTGPADGTVSGRKITVNQESAIDVDSSGTATHVALCSGSVLLYVTTITSQVVTAGNTVTIQDWSIELLDPT
jgi:hypothetical protein